VECVVRLVPPHQVRGAGKSNPIHRNRETLWNQESGIRNQISIYRRGRSLSIILSAIAQKAMVKAVGLALP